MTPLIPDDQGVILQAVPSQGRRLLILAAVAALGLLVIVLGFQIGARLSGMMLIGFGVVILAFADVLRRSTQRSIVLKTQGLFDSAGEKLAAWDDMVIVERGALAIKPSNGFALVLNVADGRRWRPGVWWRLGRRVGVGGVLRAREARFMAEHIALELAKRENGAA